MEATPVILLVALCALQTYAVDITEPCSTDANCTVSNSYCAFTYKSCTNGYCACHGDYYKPVLTNSECRPKVDIGDTCTEDEDCTSRTANSFCSADQDRVCTCDVNEEVYSDDEGRYCYAHRANEACTPGEDESCLTNYLGDYPGFGVCKTDNTCGCDITLELQGEVCMPIRRGQNCAITGQSTTKTCESNLECRDSDDTCQCPTDSTWSTAHYACISDDHVIVAQGASCDPLLIKEDQADPTLDICPANLQCGACPETSSTFVCLEPTAGASTALVSLLPLAAAFGLTLWRSL